MVGEVSGLRGWKYLAAGEAADWDDHGGGVSRSFGMCRVSSVVWCAAEIVLVAVRGRRE